MKLSETKKCGRCKEVKSFDSFYKDSYTKTKRTCLCKSCFREERREYRKRNYKKVSDYHKEYNKKYPLLAKNSKLIHDYGITLEEYNSKILRQENKCEICKKEFNTKNKPNVDHDHKTNKIRDLLCPKCNFLLGHCDESIAILEAVIFYIKKWRQ